MSWITIIWSMVAAACLTLAAMNFVIWFNKRTAWANLLFSVTAVSTAAVAACELWLMRAATAREFGVALRWAHVPYWVLIVSLVGFVGFYLRAGRLWLAWAVCGARTLSLILDFVFTPNLNFREITALRHVRFLGESVSVAEGRANPWMLVGQASFLLFVVFVVDVMLTVWRRGDRRQARWLAGAITFFALAATGQIVLVLWQIIHTPLTPSLFFLGIVAAMGFELSESVLHAGRLTDDLRESEERLNLAANSAGVGLWSWDVGNGGIWATKIARLLYGLSADGDINFDKLLATLHPDDRDEFTQSVRQASQAGADFRSEYRVVLPDGKIRWIKAQAQTLLKPSGEPDCMVGVSLDVSERKQHEADMAQLRLELEQLGRLMTMNEISASLAHEINQPLGAILNNAEAAKELLSRSESRPEEIGEIVEDIIQDTVRAGDVVRKIRGIVKKGNAFFEPLLVNPLIEDVIRLLNNNLSLNKVTLRLDLEPGLPKVMGDRVRLQQVLLNLITNAIESMTATPSKILTIRSAMQASDIVSVSVIDSGPGIDDAGKNSVFKPFFTTKKDGLGFGLSICRSIIEEHGGRIWGENNPAGGATFSFSLKAWRGESAVLPS